jgi:hypothetical protein
VGNGGSPGPVATEICRGLLGTHGRRGSGLLRVTHPRQERDERDASQAGCPGSTEHLASLNGAASRPRTQSVDFRTIAYGGELKNAGPRNYGMPTKASAALFSSGGVRLLE